MLRLELNSSPVTGRDAARRDTAREQTDAPHRVGTPGSAMPQPQRAPPSLQDEATTPQKTKRRSIS